MSMLGKNPEAHAFYSCGLCKVALVERENREYSLLENAKMVKMTVEALTDLDLAKLLLRFIELQHRKEGISEGKNQTSLLLEAALDLVRFPTGFNLRSFTAPELLAEKLRRKPVMAHSLSSSPAAQTA